MKKIVSFLLVVALCMAMLALVGCNREPITPYVGENGKWWVGETDLGVKAEGEQWIQGIQGDKYGYYH